MNIKEQYELWLKNATVDSSLLDELHAIDGEDDEISDRFYRELQFGTGGLRGVIGAGTNRMNYYTVAKATQGLANYINSTVLENPSVAISFDSRIKSDYFAKTVAEVMAGNGITAHIYKELMPTPMLSYAVRNLKCSAGVMVTASHNPAKYNGYKAYGCDGCQLTTEASDTVFQCIEKVDVFSGIVSIPFEKGIEEGKICYIKKDVVDSYMLEVKNQALRKGICDTSGLKVIYTPLNGTGNKPVRYILSESGISDVMVVPEQEMPDGTFITCPFPNPEIKEALKLGLDMCQKYRPDLLLATDPDCDRVGIAVPDPDGGYALFSGNETGAMLLEYIAKTRTELNTMPKNPLTVKTIVTTELVRAIAKKYHIEVAEVLTGFKFIGEQIGFLEKKGEESRYIFGFEESYGYLAGTYVRDKDAVVTAMLICEMAAYYRSKGITLYEARENMYKEYGYYCNFLDSFGFEGETGMQKMDAIMESLRKNHVETLGDVKVIGVADYLESVKYNVDGTKQEITLPKSNVLTFYLEDKGCVVIRPSGTEPKIKVYYMTVGTSNSDAEMIKQAYAKAFAELIF